MVKKVFVLCLSIVSLFIMESCSSNNSQISTTITTTDSSSNYESYDYSDDSYESDDYSSYSSFTNDYGTPDTVCAHSGCTNYIASSGDTNCCEEHSNTCAQCGKYIDEDAMYCIDCIKDSLQ